jgi:tetratricopeptide (TPR) repeat protein
LPDALADVVLARLEQLPPLAKQVLQTASVIGREFTFRMLRQVWDGEEQLDAALLELESRALCYAKHDAWEPVYGFAHSVHGYSRMQGLYTTFLGATHLLQGDIDKARELVHQGVELARVAQDRFGIGWAVRMLGHVDATCGHYNEAQRHFHVALRAFTTLQASFEVARTQLALAEVAYQQGGHDMATAHLREAYQQFTSLDVAAYVQHTQQRAAELGLPLPCSASA